MGFISIPGGLWIPRDWPSTSVAYTSFLMDASAEKVAPGVFRVPKTGTLDKFEFRLGAVTQAPASGLRCSFQDLDASGDPDGVADQFRVVTAGLTANAWVAPGLLTSDGTDTGTKRSVTRGQRLACVVAFESFAAGDSLNLTAITGTSSGNFQTAYVDHFTAAWAKDSSRAPCLALKYDDGTYAFIPGVFPASGAVSTSFNSGSTPDEIGMTFRFGAPVGISAAAFTGSPGATGRDLDLVLYDTDGVTELEAVRITAAETTIAAGYYYAPFSTERYFLADTTYRLAVRPATAGSITLAELQVNAAAILDAFEGGQTWQRTHRTNAGAWTDTTTQRPLIALQVTAFDPIKGGGPAERWAGSVRRRQRSRRR